MTHTKVKTRCPIGQAPLRLTSSKGGMSFEITEHADRIGRHAGVAPAVVLNRPLYARNLAAAVRACTAWGVEQLWWTGDRITAEIEGSSRLPREERMRAYSSVKLLWHDQPLNFFPEGTVPVCVELTPQAEPLHHFVHPENAVYVFGPEDGSVAKGFRVECHRFLMLPTAHCLNLAAAINCVLMHRRFQRIADGREPDRYNDWLAERRGGMYDMSEEG